MKFNSLVKTPCNRALHPLQSSHAVITLEFLRINTRNLSFPISEFFLSNLLQYLKVSYYVAIFSPERLGRHCALSSGTRILCIILASSADPVGCRTRGEHTGRERVTSFDFHRHCFSTASVVELYRHVCIGNTVYAVHRTHRGICMSQWRANDESVGEA